MIIKSTFIFGILSATAAVALITGRFASEQTALGLSVGSLFTSHVQAREKIFFDGQNQADFKQVSDCSASTHEPNSPILPGSCTSNSCSSNGEMVSVLKIPHERMQILQQKMVLEQHQQPTAPDDVN
jgi:hypothetical protein